MELECCLNI